MSLIPWHRKHASPAYPTGSTAIPVHRDGFGGGAFAREPFDSIQNHMQRWMKDLFGFEPETDVEDSMLSHFAAPLVDITEGEKGYTVSAELPAMQPEDLSVSVQGDRLVIRGEKKSEKSQKNDEDIVIRSERYFGVLQRSLSLPHDANMDAITADFNNGVLVLTIPKQEGAVKNSRQIPIR